MYVFYFFYYYYVMIVIIILAARWKLFLDSSFSKAILRSGKFHKSSGKSQEKIWEFGFKFSVAIPQVMPTFISTFLFCRKSKEPSNNNITLFTFWLNLPLYYCSIICDIATTFFSTDNTKVLYNVDKTTNLTL